MNKLSTKQGYSWAKQLVAAFPGCSSRKTKRSKQSKTADRKKGCTEPPPLEGVEEEQWCARSVLLSPPQCPNIGLGDSKPSVVRL